MDHLKLSTYMEFQLPFDLVKDFNWPAPLAELTLTLGRHTRLSPIDLVYPTDRAWPEFAVWLLTDPQHGVLQYADAMTRPVVEAVAKCYATGDSLHCQPSSNKPGSCIMRRRMRRRRRRRGRRGRRRGRRMWRRVLEITSKHGGKPRTANWWRYAASQPETQHLHGTPTPI